MLNLKKETKPMSESKVAETMIRQNFLTTASASGLKKFLGNHDSNIHKFYSIFE